ncbi:MAG TPA: PspC domain-containing protein [Saprospiraceae bacterium]|nr:PspC domain-containing protein [Saprospiraceae bacterium]
MQFFRDLIEKSFFGVCQYIGNKIGVSISQVRLYFIYISFVTMGSPVIIYLFIAFWLNIRKYFRRSFSYIFE